MATKTWLGTTSADVTTAANWSPSGQPTAGDDVIITGSNNVDGATLSASGNLASFVVRDYTGAIGSATADLVVDLAAASTVTIATSGKAYIDFNASDVSVSVYETQASNGSTRGLELKGTSLNYIHNYGSSSTRLFSGTLDNDFINYDAGGTATIESGAGAVNLRGPGTTVAYGSLTNIYTSGTVTYYGAGAITTAQADSGGVINYLSGQNITNANAYGGTIDGSKSNETITVTNTDATDGGEITPGDNWTITNNPSDSYKIVAA